MEQGLSKLELRTKILKERDALPEDIQCLYSDMIAENLLKNQLYQNAETIFSYVSFRSEVNTFRIIDAALDSGKKVCCPKITDNKMTFVRINSREELHTGYFGVLEPLSSLSYEEKLNENILILTPGSVFDRHGYRIGYGKGFYDRFFIKAHESRHAIVGLSYQMQIIREIPHTAFDYPLDYIFTENEIIQKR